MSLVQIIASMPTVLSGVNFPPFFILVTDIFGVFNFDILSLSKDFSTAFGCSMSVRFFDRFIIHLLLPVLCLSAIGLAVITAEPILRCCSNKTQRKKNINNMNEAIFKVIVLVVLLLFPGLSTKLFSMFNCRSFDGIEDKLFLFQDYSVECNQGEHAKFTVIAWIFLGVYIIGIPLLMWCSLCCNKKHLHDITSKKHHLVRVSLGGLYWQYEPQYWWFEFIILLNKTMMCGGLVVLAPGSPSQVLCGILIMLFHLLLVLAITPYHNYTEDVSGVVSALGLTLIYICSLMKMLENSTKDDLSYISTLLDVLPVLSVVLILLIMVFMDCKCAVCRRKKKQEMEKEKERKVTSSKKVQVFPEKKIVAVEKEAEGPPMNVGTVTDLPIDHARTARLSAVMKIQDKNEHL